MSARIFRTSPKFWYSLIVACLLWSAPAVADASATLYQYRPGGPALFDSKLSPMTLFQRALSDALIACDQNGIAADGQFGPGSRKAIQRLSSCAGWEDTAWSPDNPLHGTVDTKLWRRVLPGTPFPDAGTRAFGLVLALERTDYNRVEWNYGTGDDRSALTWGPFGATAGHGNEIRAILERFIATAPGLVDQAFGREAAFVRRFITAPGNQGYALLKPEYGDSARKHLWTQALEHLGALPEGRAAYDWYAFVSGKWFTAGLKRLKSLVTRRAVTEIDHAFFLDLAVHASIKRSRIDESRTAIEAETARRGRALTPAEMRQAIGSAFAARVNPRWRNDRLGRNVVFYVDGVGITALSGKERTVWRHRSGYRASYYGLSDKRSTVYP